MIKQVSNNTCFNIIKDYMSFFPFIQLYNNKSIEISNKSWLCIEIYKMANSGAIYIGKYKTKYGQRILDKDVNVKCQYLFNQKREC